jgi:hypothetical protein
LKLRGGGVLPLFPSSGGGDHSFLFSSLCKDFRRICLRDDMVNFVKKKRKITKKDEREERKKHWFYFVNCFASNFFDLPGPEDEGDGCGVSPTPLF